MRVRITSSAGGGVPAAADLEEPVRQLLHRGPDEAPQGLQSDALRLHQPLPRRAQARIVPRAEAGPAAPRGC